VSLSASIPTLKSRARKLRRAESIPLCEALDRIAAAEGFSTWSLLIAKAARRKELIDRLDPGDLVLLGARPGQGKTICALELVISSLRRYEEGWFFLLQNDAFDIDAAFERLGAHRSAFANTFVFEHSDEICAQGIVARIGNSISKKAIVVIDYLQLLDQRRKSPPLQEQVSALAALAKRTGCIVILISQILSAFDAKTKRLPSIADIRLLDDLDPSIFSKLVFLHEGRLRVQRHRTM
jgi:replicative DNA helicase